jgi:hypothetical protein
MSKKYDILLIILSFLALFFNKGNGQNLKIINGESLYYFGNTAFKILELNDLDCLRGYDFIDSTRIFIAYTNCDGSEVYTRLDIFDINERKMNHLKSLGATGESYFSYNPDNGLIVFNWYNGIHVISLKELIQTPRTEDVPTTHLVDTEVGYYPFWASVNRIGYFILKDGEMHLNYYKLDSKLK